MNLRIVKGDLSPEEIAALVAVLTSRPPPAAEPAPHRSAWADRSRAVRRPLPHGPGAWRSTALP